jgi:hypothetical protein
MKFLPLLRSNLMRRKVRTICTGLSIFVAFVLIGALMSIRAGFFTRSRSHRRRSARGEPQELVQSAAADGVPRSAGSHPRRRRYQLHRVVSRRLPGSEERLSEARG